MLKTVNLRTVTKPCLRYHSSASAATLKKTPLYDVHIQNGAKMVPYANFDMPILYKDQSHIESHHWVRNHTGLFDVSHMLQHKFTGKGATDFLQKITPSDLKNLPIHSSTLSVLLNNEGGVIDDCIITKHGEDDFYMVTNAGCIDKDTKFINDEKKSYKDGDFTHNSYHNTLLAIQGPEAANTLQSFTKTDLSKLTFGNSIITTLDKYENSPIHIARSGYTGEDGFEISIPDNETAISFTNDLLKLEEVRLIGLAARDSLRLEAGMCLYGNELTESISPVEASLSWLIPKSRQSDANFNGSSKILQHLANKKSLSSRVGLVSGAGPAPRTGAPIYDTSKNPSVEIGHITSGCSSPTLGKNIAMGYVAPGFKKSGTKLGYGVRGKVWEAVVTKMPFVESKFYRGS